MIRLEDLIRVHRIERHEVMAWIEAQWIRPQRTDGDWLFDPLDEARVQLICELRQDMQVGDEAMPIVLSLLDQLYAAREVLNCVNRAIQDLPPPLRDEIRDYLKSRVPEIGEPD